MKSDLEPTNAPKNQPEKNPQGLDQARQLFAQEGLPFPTLPAELAPHLRLLAPWVFGTRALPVSLYDLDWFIEEAVAGKAEDYILLGHAGHGINSWAIHYYVVQGPLGLFIQIGYGGAYMERDRSIAKLRKTFEEATELLDSAREAQHTGEFDPSQHLLVVESDLTGSRWTWRGLNETEAKNLAWQTGSDAIAGAVQVIHTGKSGKTIRKSK